MKGKSRGVKSMEDFWLDIIILCISDRVCTKIGHLLLRCNRVENGGVDFMYLDISRSKDGAIQEVLIRKGFVLVSGQQLGVSGIDKRWHVIATAHVIRKSHISISYSNVKKLLCPVI